MATSNRKHQSRRRQLDPGSRREPAPIVVRYQCPLCAGPHPRAQCSDTVDDHQDRVPAHAHDTEPDLEEAA
jgi:hypothetical protein